MHFLSGPLGALLVLAALAPTHSARQVTPVTPSGQATITRPTRLEGYPCGNSIELHWRDNSSGELGFVIERRAAAGGSFRTVFVTAPNVDEYTDTAPNGAFEYRVAARFPAGAATFDSRTTRTVEVTFPNAPPVITTDLPARPFQ